MRPHILSYFTPYLLESPARARGCLPCSNFQGQFYAEHLLRERDGGRHVGLESSARRYS